MTKKQKSSRKRMQNRVGKNGKSGNSQQRIARKLAVKRFGYQV